MAKIELSSKEMSGLVQEVLKRLARDPEADHLWHWRGRPGCADEPAGPSRRNHLATLLGLLGTAALGGAAGCGSSTSKSDAKPDQPQACADDPCAVDLGKTLDKGVGVDTKPKADMPQSCADDPCSTPLPDGPRPCGDDPCACGDDPCGCADDPCACADDPCACGDDPCGGPKPDFGVCADDPCMCADDPCGGP